MKTIVANFKMNPTSEKEVVSLLENYQKNYENFKNVNLIIAPPFVYLDKAKNLNFSLAAQNCFYLNEGPYTGEISPLMLKNLGVQYVIVGHSERRQMGETDEIINKKIQSILNNELTPILCIGETKEEKLKGKKEEVLKNQLEKDLKLENNLSPVNKSIFIAYEPVWAIGTGDFCDPEEANLTHQFIKEFIHYQFFNFDVKILYGGSVDSKNIKNFLNQLNIDGALVGGASIKKEEIAKILEIANSY